MLSTSLSQKHDSGLLLKKGILVRTNQRGSYFNMLGADELKSLQWRSRRGMLELDVLLEPFTRHALAGLSKADQQTYVRLLACEDPDLFSWFMGDASPEDQALRNMVERVLAYGRNKGELV